MQHWPDSTVCRTGSSTPPPTMSMDFTGGTLDGRVTFTRADASTCASYTNSSGVVSLATANTPRFDYDASALYQVTNTMNLSVVTTLGFNSTDGVATASYGNSPLGTKTSTRVNGTTSGVFHFGGFMSAADASGTTYAISLYMKCNTQMPTSIYTGNSNGTGGTNFLISNVGGVPTPNGGGSVVTLANGWYRLILPYTASAANANPSVVFTMPVGAWDVELWGFQKEVSSTAHDYVATAGSPVTQQFGSTVPKGLLIEESRTNLVTNSVPTAFGFNGTDGVATANFGISPAGTTTSTKVAGTTSGAFHFGAMSAADTNATAYSVTFYVKYLMQNFSAGIYVGDATSTGGQGYTVTVTNNVPSLNGSGTATPVGNGWYRLFLPYTSSAANTAPSIVFSTPAAAWNFEVWGFQKEAATAASSYIPTTAAAVTRAQDSATITGTNFTSWWNASVGTFVVSADSWAANSNSSNIIDTSPTVNELLFGVQSGLVQNHDGTNGLSQSATALPTLTPRTSGMYYDQANSLKSVCTAGGVVNAGAYSGSWSTSTGLRIGINGAHTTALNGHIRRLSYWNTRLSDTQLRTLTAT